MKKIFLNYIVAVFVLTSCGSSNSEEEYAIEGQTAEGFEDGTHCASVTYNNPNTGTEKTYTLEVEVSGNQVTQINWNNGGWLDEDHFTPEELDVDGKCSFSSDKGYDYTVEIIGEHCNNLDSEGQYTKLNLPKYSLEEAVAIVGMTQEEINESNIFSEGDVLSENDLFILKRDRDNIRTYLNTMRGYDQGYEQDISDIMRSQKKLQDEIANGYVQRIERRSMYGATIQTVTISKHGVNYLFEVRGGGEVTMGTAQFNENATGWQTVYIKQYPDVEKYSGYSMRIIDRGF
jgi:hypothetical protein